MYRVIIVDDEPWTVQSITETLPWSRYDMQVTGSFSKASAALTAILEEKPDVVFTDIRMPVVSGIQLMQILRENRYDTEIVVISGYDQFDYVRDSLRLGAFDYCLKPLNGTYVNELLSRLKEKLDQKSKEKNSRLLEALTNDFIQEDDETIISAIPVQADGYQVICVSTESDDETLLSLLSLYEAACVRFDAGKYRYYLVNTNQSLYDGHSLHERLAGSASSIGFSRFSTGIQSIPALLSEAAVASHAQFMTGRAHIGHYHEPRISMLISLMLRLGNMLLSESDAEYSLFVQETESCIRNSSLTIEELCFLGNQLILYTAGKQQSQELSSDALCSDWNDLLSRFSSAEEYILYLSSACETHSSSFPESGSSVSKDSTIGKMLAFLNENYTQQIYLKDLAERFFINKNYASLLFRRHTGMNYSDYLNSLRLNRAKELLGATSLSISEVAEQSGYSDYFYFNKLFKKTFGITPAKYRRQAVLQGQ